VNTRMNSCEHIKELLVAEGRFDLEQNEHLKPHVSDCPECRRLLRAWEKIPEWLEQLPEHEPEKALLENIRQAVLPTRQNENARRSRFLVPSLASLAVLLAAIGLSRELLMREYPKVPAPVQLPTSTGQVIHGTDNKSADGAFGDGFTHAQKQQALNQPSPAESRRLDQPADYSGSDASRFSEQEEVLPGSKIDLLNEVGARLNDTRSEPHRAAERGFKGRVMAQQPPPPQVSQMESDDRDKADAGKGLQSVGNKLKVAGREEFKKEPRKRQSVLGEAVVPAVTGGTGFGLAASPRIQLTEPLDFIAHYRHTENLSTRAATGYWANSYVPGDPEIRLLSARLAMWDRSWLQNSPRLEQDVTPVKQLFDPPSDNALALSLMADTRAIAAHGDAGTPTRLRLQVGIQGTEHRRGQRPAMNVGVVVDLPADAPDEVRIATRALLDALLQNKQTGDHFSLVLTSQKGKASGLIVESDDFRFGSLQLAKQLILGEKIDHRSQSGESLDLYTAMQVAGDMVQQSDDPGQPLGSSSVLLISAKTVTDPDKLTALTHQRATEGITLSVVPLGLQSQSNQVEQLVLAGLGNRRYLESPAQARQLIEEELHSSSRAVARAVRLSIKLARGVQLIGVVGSQRLDTRDAQRVREIENSMDNRLATNRGIQADRGEDEDGIQIVIPGIYSGDSVTVLLDVLTDRPGAIADVTLRYKDLVFMQNSRLSSHLELPGGELDRGPGELSVLKNLLSIHFSEALENASEALGRQQNDFAVSILKAMRTTIEQARRDQPGWANDPDLIHDQQLLDRYIAAMTSPGAGTHQSFLTDSLRYAAWAKSHRPLEEWQK
jgi:hypothetical protein